MGKWPFALEDIRVPGGKQHRGIQSHAGVQHGVRRHDAVRQIARVGVPATHRRQDECDTGHPELLWRILGLAQVQYHARIEQHQLAGIERDHAVAFQAVRHFEVPGPLPDQ